MIKEILMAAGILHAQGRFLRLPEETHAVYFDDIDADGADPVPGMASAKLGRIYAHNVRVELYEPTPDDDKETVLEAEMDARGLPWAKTDRVWLPDVQRYQVMYETTYTEKRRRN